MMDKILSSIIVALLVGLGTLIFGMNAEINEIQKREEAAVKFIVVQNHAVNKLDDHENRIRKLERP